MKVCQKFPVAQLTGSLVLWHWFFDPDLLPSPPWRTPDVPDRPSRSTAASKMASPASAMASRAWLVAPGVTAAEQVSTVVRPSISVLRRAPLSRALFLNSSGREALAAPKGLPPLIRSTDTGRLVPGTRAQLVPLMEMANTSL